MKRRGAGPVNGNNGLRFLRPPPPRFSGNNSLGHRMSLPFTHISPHNQNLGVHPGNQNPIINGPGPGLNYRNPISNWNCPRYNRFHQQQIQRFHRRQSSPDVGARPYRHPCQFDSVPDFSQFQNQHLFNSYNPRMFPPSFIPPQEFYRQTNNIYPTQTSDPPPYIPTPVTVRHFPILRLYNREEGPIEEYQPGFVPQNPVVTGYTKVGRDSRSSLPDDEECEQKVVQIDIDAKKLQLLIQNFHQTKPPDILKNEENTNTPLEKVCSEPQNKVAKTDKLEATSTTQRIHGLEEHLEPLLVRTPKGFYVDDNEFVEVYIAADICRLKGKYERNTLATYGVWFGGCNEWNYGHVSKGLVSVKAAGILAAEKAISLLKENFDGNDHFKIKINTDSTFLFSNVRNWAVKWTDQPHFEPSNWDEFKYVTEISQLCRSFSDVIVKWTLVDPKNVGTKSAKVLANKAQEDLTERD